MRKLLVLLFLLGVLRFCYLNFYPVMIPVLTYHDFVEDNPTNSMQIQKKVFEEEMKYLSDHHYKSLTMKDIRCFLKKKCTLPRKSVLITMDDGWKNELTIAAPILKKYHLNATIFYIGEHYDGSNPNFMSSEDLELLQDEYPNIEIAHHSYALHYEDADLLSKDEIQGDLKRVKELISSNYYAYPYGRYSKQYQKALKEEDYSLAFTFGPGKEHRKLKQDDNIYELPRLNMSNGMPKWKFIMSRYW